MAASVFIKNSNFHDDSVTPLPSWTIGAANAWAPSDSSPFNHGVYGSLFLPGTGNTITQTGVFPDFGTATQHRVKVNVTLVTGGGTARIMFGTVTAGTITTTGIQYFTNSAATNSNLSFDIAAGLVALDYAVMADVDASYADYTTYVQPAYNPFYFLTTSIHTAQPNFQYRFDIFTGNTGSGNPQATIKLLPRPIVANCVFSPARILESYLSYDLNIQTITGATNSKNNITPYTILFGEEYGTLSTGTTIYSGMSFFTGYTFNGVLQYSELPVWKFTDYALSGSTSKFLTNQPRSGTYIKNITDRGTLAYMQNIYANSSSSADTEQVVVYQNSGGSITYNFTVSAQTGQIVHIPSGIWNLNNSLFGTVINLNTDYKYTIQMMYSKAPISEALLYRIDTNCSKYETVRFMFLNRMGGFDYVNFNMVSRKTINIKKGEYKRVLPYNYAVGERGRTILDVDANHTYMVTSDWLNQDESNWIEELLTSNEVYTISSTGVATPITIDENSVEILKNINIDTKLMNYTFNYSDAFKVDIQRG